LGVIEGSPQLRNRGGQPLILINLLQRALKKNHNYEEERGMIKVHEYLGSKRGDRYLRRGAQAKQDIRERKYDGAKKYYSSRIVEG